MLTALLLILQTPSTPYAELWIPECKEALSVEGPLGYRTCARVATAQRGQQLTLREKEYRELLEDADRSSQIAEFDADIARFTEYRSQHCEYLGQVDGRVSLLGENRALSCRYHLTDRRIAELDQMILLFTPVFVQP